MRVNYADLMRGAGDNAAPSPTTIGDIYYLQTSTPHKYDVSISGPYPKLEVLMYQAMLNFGEECTEGWETLEQLLEDGMLGFEHVTSPINHDPNKTKTVRVIKEQNPGVAAKLGNPPLRAWCVFSSTFALDYAGPRLAHAPLKDMWVHGTFESKEAAFEAARKLAQDMAARLRRGRVLEDGLGQGTQPLCVLSLGVTGQEANGAKHLSTVTVKDDYGGMSERPESYHTTVGMS